jgi:ABC-type glycerol-3-phosphate transport system substrate-binding protein
MAAFQPLVVFEKILFQGEIMDKLSFALYGTHSQFIDNISPILKEFESNTGTPIETTEMSIDDAWPKLLQYTIHGGGPDLARIGTIWTSSLMSLNALRPFRASEITRFGGEDAFIKPIWKSGISPDDAKVWAIPFTSFNYVLFYRKDLLVQGGIDETDAFSTAESMINTLARLKASDIQSPWVIPSGEHYRARLHILASWIWGADGHFLDEDGKQILLSQSEALSGLKHFFELHRYLSPMDYGLTPNECRRRFARGQTTIYIGGPDTFQLLSELNPSPDVIGNIGVSALPGIPWIGGSSLVVWKDVVAKPATEHSIHQLISMLTEKSTQKLIYELSHVPPARVDAFEGLKLDHPELLQVEKAILETGRSYRPYSIWLRIQNDLVHVLDRITAEFLDDTSVDVLPVIRKHLDPIVKRYDLILSAM